MYVRHLDRIARGRCTAGIAAVAICLAAVPASAEPAQDGVMQAEDARLRAEIAHDMPRLEHLVAPDLWYAHANGRTQDRAEYLAAIARADGPVRDARLFDRSVQVEGRIAVTHGTVDYLVRTDDRPRRARYLAAYRRGPDGWRLIAWQNSAVADAK